MKTVKTSLLIPVAIAASFTTLNAQAPSPAETPKTAATASASATPAGTPAQQTDPFIKKQSASPSTGEAKTEEPKYYDIRFTVEVYALAQDDAARLIEENSSGEARHDRVLELASKGKARFETLLTDVTQSGQRSVVEQIFEVPYPTEFGLPVSGEASIKPVDYEVRNVGDTLEYEPVISTDSHFCDINLVLSSVQLKELHDYGAQGSPRIQPIFGSRKFTTSVRLSTGSVAYLGTLSSVPKFEETGSKSQEGIEVRLAFGHVELMEIAVAKLAERPEENATLEEILSFYSLSRDAARKILAAEPKPGASYAAVKALADRGEARLERITTLKTKSGQRAAVEEVKEVSVLGRDTKHDKRFQTCNIGLMLEIEPVLGPGQHIELNIVPQLVMLQSDQKTKRIAAEYPPPPPLFETRRVTTSLIATLGEQALIGTFSPPGDNGVNGNKDTGRVWLGFIKTTLAEP